MLDKNATTGNIPSLSSYFGISLIRNKSAYPPITKSCKKRRSLLLNETEGEYHKRNAESARAKKMLRTRINVKDTIVT